MSTDVVSPSGDVTLLCPALAPPGLRMCPCDYIGQHLPGHVKAGLENKQAERQGRHKQRKRPGNVPHGRSYDPARVVSIIPKAVFSVEGRGCATVVNYCTPFPFVILVAVLRLIDARTALGFSFQEFTTCIMSNQGSLTIIKSPSSVLTSVLFQVRESNWRTSAVRPSFSLTIDPTR